MPDVQIVGHVCMDLTPRLPGPADTTPGVLTEVGPMGLSVGGAVANGGRAALALGHSAALAGMVGQDELGTLCRDMLERDFPGNVSITVTSERSTSYSVVVQPPDTDRNFWHHTGSNDVFRGECTLFDAPVVHFGYPTLVPGMMDEGGQPTIDLFSRARSRGSATSLDLAFCAENSPLRSADWEGYFANVLPLTDVFCPSWDDITSSRGQPTGFDAAAIEDCARQFIAMGAGLVLISAGHHGSHLAIAPGQQLRTLAPLLGGQVGEWAGTSHWIPAVPPTRLVSTNGAGDTFKVAFLLYCRALQDPVSAARAAARAVSRWISNEPLVG